ncbi:MAG: hypothetical protein LBF33_01355 [Oscillospiraceae bacterium]|nr:hypothetical protein [Oscillospiraceae bacterium]
MSKVTDKIYRHIKRGRNIANKTIGVLERFSHITSKRAKFLNRKTRNKHADIGRNMLNLAVVIAIGFAIVLLYSESKDLDIF